VPKQKCENTAKIKIVSQKFGRKTLGRDLYNRLHVKNKRGNPMLLSFINPTYIYHRCGIVGGHNYFILNSVLAGAWLENPLVLILYWIDALEVNMLVAHCSGATLLSHAAAWKTLSCHHCIRVGGAIVRPVVLPVGWPDHESDAHVDRCMWQTSHAIGMSIMVALDTSHATCEWWMVVWQDVDANIKRRPPDSSSRLVIRSRL
jgi:hypothetical protein